MSSDFTEINEDRRESRETYGKVCFGCINKYPKRNPTILFEYQTCKVCGYKRPSFYNEEVYNQNFYVLPFGKYKNQFFKDIDMQYLDWLYTDMKSKKDTIGAIQTVLFNKLERFLNIQ